MVKTLDTSNEIDNRDYLVGRIDSFSGKRFPDLLSARNYLVQLSTEIEMESPWAIWADPDGPCTTIAIFYDGQLFIAL